MSPNKRRKLSPTSDESEDVSASAPTKADPEESAEFEPLQVSEQVEPPTEANTTLPASNTITSPNPSSDRTARFAALRARAIDSTRANLSAAKLESQRTALDPSVLANLSRRSAIAQHNLLKADTEESGGTGSFERKRAWDYTIEESEKWDERMAQKRSNKNKNAFQDYSAEAGKIYDRQVREMENMAAGSNNNSTASGKGGQGGKGRLREDYDLSKTALLESAAQIGNLEIVELPSGELVAIDKDGRFFTHNTSSNTQFIEQKPPKANIDRLVSDLQKAEDIRMKKRKARGMDEGEKDVSYINEKNKQFNMKLARFYDRYTGDIRESFERGSAI